MIIQSVENINDIEFLKKKIHQQEIQIQNLSASVQKYKKLFNISNNAIFIVSLDGIISELNYVASERYKYKSEEYLAMPFIDIVSQSERTNYLNNFQNTITDGQSVIDSVHTTKTGKKFPVELTSRIFEYDGQEAVLIIAKDITGRKEYQEKLEHERDLFKTLMDNIPDRIYFKDINSKFTLVNKAQSSNFHLTNCDKAIGKCDHDFFDKKHADQALNDEQKIINTKKSIISKIEREKIQSHDRDYEWVNTTKVPIINKNGTVTGLVGISRNVTDIKNAERKIIKYAKELQYLNAGKDKFFSIIAHDLKNPFFSLLGFSELLANNYDQLSDNEKKNYIDNIIKISKNSYQLLENLLQWARSQTGRIDYCPTEFDLKNIMDEIAEFFSPIAQKKKIKIINNVKKSVLVYADSNMMRTIIRNLITNAIKFTSEGNDIQLDSVDEKAQYKIIVSDHGRGMDDDTIKNLFRIDINHKSIGTENEAGTGLGLIICKEFVEKNGGEITATSKIDMGSKFTFTVPKQI